MPTQSKPVREKDRASATGAAAMKKTKNSNKEQRSLPDKENTSSRSVPAAATRSSGRQSRPSEKVASRLQEEEEAAEKTHAVLQQREERAKKAQRREEREAGIERDNASDDEVADSGNFSSRIVPSKPSTKSLTQRKEKVPTPSVFKPVSVNARNTDHSDRSPTPVGRGTYHRRNHISDSDDESIEPDRDDRGRSRYRHRDSASRSRHHRQESTPPSRSISNDVHWQAQSPQVQSPATGTKRGRSPSIIDLDDTPPSKAQKVQENKGRPKAKDYDSKAQQMLSVATLLYRSYISAIDAFPNIETELAFTTEAWQRAYKKLGFGPVELTNDIAKLIQARGSQIRGEAKAKTRAMVEVCYGFKSGGSRKTIAANRKLAEDLKDGFGYLYKILGETPADRKGLYQHPIIQKAINAIWFSSRHSDGITHTDIFDPFPHVGIALTLAAIECDIDEWATGTKTDIAFTKIDYEDPYRKHLAELKRYGDHTKSHKLLPKMCERLYNFGRIHAGVAPKAMVDVPVLTIDAFKAAIQEYEEDTETEDDGEMD